MDGAAELSHTHSRVVHVAVRVLHFCFEYALYFGKRSLLQRYKSQLFLYYKGLRWLVKPLPHSSDLVPTVILTLVSRIRYTVLLPLPRLLRLRFPFNKSADEAAAAE
jgi:hypothetical protein